MSGVTAFQRGKHWYFSIHDGEFVQLYGSRIKQGCQAKGKREAIKLGESERDRLMAEAQSKQLHSYAESSRILLGGKPAPSPTDTFTLFIENWYQPWSTLNKRPSTCKSDAWRLRVLNEYFGHAPLNQISRPMVETFKSLQRNTINQYERKQSGATVNRLLELGGSIYTKVAEWTDYEYNPFRRVKHFRETARKRVMSPQEEAQLAACLQLPARKMLRLCILLALHAGLRKGEILNLRNRDVEVAHEWLMILDAKTGDRIVPISIVVRNALKSAMSLSGDPGELIFGGVDWIKDSWPTICREAGIKGLRFHDLRATYVTRILEAGFDGFTARDAVGHANIKTTGIYARTSLERVRSAVNSLPYLTQVWCNPGAKREIL